MLTEDDWNDFKTSESTSQPGMFQLRGFLSVFEINFYINKISVGVLLCSVVVVGEQQGAARHH